tara:strand:- start:62 stop:577 length:516 start_codon:yes stop_codon:yes gene_type:complete
MSNEIKNRVSQSSIKTLDLEEFYPKGKREFIDLSQWLENGLVLREKEFRKKIESHKWTSYKDKYVAIGCLNNAILPSWASLLVASNLEPFAIKIIHGSLKELENNIIVDLIRTFDTNPYKDKPVMIKGCSDNSIPENAYVQLIILLKTVSKSLFYGEACSSVPIWKRSKIS